MSSYQNYPAQKFKTEDDNFANVLEIEEGQNLNLKQSKITNKTKLIVVVGGIIFIAIVGIICDFYFGAKNKNSSKLNNSNAASDASITTSAPNVSRLNLV